MGHGQVKYKYKWQVQIFTPISQQRFKTCQTSRLARIPLASFNFYFKNTLAFYVFQVVDEDGKFREDNFSEAMAVLADKGGDEGGGGKRKSAGGAGGKSAGGETDCFKIVKMIMERNFAPVIVFSFSKKECEAYALQMSKLDFNTRKLS